MSTSSDKTLSELEKEGWVLISSGEHVCTLLSKEEARTQKKVNDPYVIVIQDQERVVTDIKRLAIAGKAIEGETVVCAQKKQYKFNGESFEGLLENFYNKNYKTKKGNKAFLAYASDSKSNFAELVKDFFEKGRDLGGMAVPEKLTITLMETLTADAFFHRLAVVLPEAMFTHKRFLDNSTLLKEIDIFFDPNLKEINVYERYIIPQTKKVDDMEGPHEACTLQTLSHVRLKLDDTTNEPQVSAQYYAAASLADIKYAATVIKEVTPQGQNPRVNGENVDLSVDHEGRTALHRAVLREDLNLVLILLKNKLVDINATDEQGKTALHYAAEKNLENVVLALVDRGADCTIRDKNKQKYAYEYATETGPKPVKQFLQALTLVEGYLIHEKAAQGYKKIGIAQGMRECLVESVSCNPVSPIAARITNITNKMTDEENKKKIKKDIENELTKHKHSIIETFFGRFIMDLAKILDLDVAKKSQDIIVPEDGESHGEAFCKQLSAAVLKPRPRSESAPAMLSYSLAGQLGKEDQGSARLLRRVLSSPSLPSASFFPDKVKQGCRESEHKPSAMSPCNQRPLRYRLTPK